MRLLSDNLSPLQRDQLALFKYFEVIGGDTGTHYRIHCRHQMNVEMLNGRGERTRILCFMPKGHLPVGDTMLAQKIALELFEREALRIANEQPVWIELGSGRRTVFGSSGRNWKRASKRTTIRSSKRTKLYAVRDKKGQFKTSRLTSARTGRT